MGLEYNICGYRPVMAGAIFYGFRGFSVEENEHGGFL